MAGALPDGRGSEKQARVGIGESQPQSEYVSLPDGRGSEKQARLGKAGSVKGRSLTVAARKSRRGSEKPVAGALPDGRGSEKQARVGMGESQPQNEYVSLPDP